MLTVYGINSCDACKKARSYLAQHEIDHQFHDLRDDGIDIKTLDRWVERIGWEEILNKRSLTWRKIPEVDRANLARDKAIALMLERPTLIKRPVLEAEDYIAAGFSEERFAELRKNFS